MGEEEEQDNPLIFLDRLNELILTRRANRTLYRQNTTRE